jgi:hypothetical protein
LLADRADGFLRAANKQVGSTHGLEFRVYAFWAVDQIFDVTKSKNLPFLQPIDLIQLFGAPI